jgi:tRNA A58 N-methylase Trm61
MIENGEQQTIIRSSGKLTDSSSVNTQKQFQATLDFDLAFLDPKEPYSAIPNYLLELNTTHFRVFAWSITDKLRKVLDS